MEDLQTTTRMSEIQKLALHHTMPTLSDPLGERPHVSVIIFFKHCLLPNHKANLDETWQGCSLGEALQKLFKEFNCFITLVVMAIKRKKSKIFENLL